MDRLRRYWRPVLVAVCIVLAVASNLALTQFGRQFSVTYCDYHWELKGGPAGEPIVLLGGGIADTFCAGPFAGSRKPREMAAAIADLVGVFPAQGVSPDLALWAGVLMPLSVLLCAAFIALQAFLSPVRTIATIMLAVLGMAATYVICAILAFSPSPPGDWITFLWLPTIPLVLFAGVFWLWRTRSPKQPA